ncbi:nucleotidyltransferase domain-containing protein [Draconibacterium sp.]|jgi:predicted nucleotidyltransferase
MDSSEFLNTIQSEIRKFDKNAEIILYGSRARGDYRCDSDWDILILLNSSIDEELKEKIRDKLFEIELETEQAISSIIQSKKKWSNLSITPFYHNVEKEGVQL